MYSDKTVEGKRLNLKHIFECYNFLLQPSRTWTKNNIFVTAKPNIETKESAISFPSHDIKKNAKKVG